MWASTLDIIGGCISLVLPATSYCNCADTYFMCMLAEKLLYFSEKFDAKIFISRIHQDTSAADLEKGAFALKTDLKGRTQQRKQLVKDNFDCFVSCKTTIDGMQRSLVMFIFS